MKKVDKLTPASILQPYMKFMTYFDERRTVTEKELQYVFTGKLADELSKHIEYDQVVSPSSMGRYQEIVYTARVGLINDLGETARTLRDENFALREEVGRLRWALRGLK